MPPAPAVVATAAAPGGPRLSSARCRASRTGPGTPIAASLCTELSAPRPSRADR